MEVDVELPSPNRSRTRWAQWEGQGEFADPARPVKRHDHRSPRPCGVQQPTELMELVGASGEHRGRGGQLLEDRQDGRPIGGAASTPGRSGWRSRPGRWIHASVRVFLAYTSTGPSGSRRVPGSRGRRGQGGANSCQLPDDPPVAGPLSVRFRAESSSGVGWSGLDEGVDMGHGGWETALMIAVDGDPGLTPSVDTAHIRSEQLGPGPMGQQSWGPTAPSLTRPRPHQPISRRSAVISVAV